MTIAPMLPPWLIALVIAAALALTVMAVRRTRGALHLWLPRGLVVLLFALVLLRPGVATEEAHVVAAQTDVFFVVDTTASSAALDGDLGAPRLDAMRADALALADDLAGARFSLITFDSRARVRVPLTTDATALATAIAVTRAEVSAHSAGSSVGLAADLLAAELGRAAADSPQRARVVYYFGDGEQTLPSAPESFASSAHFLGGGKVLGYGTAAGGVMPLDDGSGVPTGAVVLDPSAGTPAVSSADPTTLEAIGDQLGVPFEARQAASVLTAGDVRASSIAADGTVARGSRGELYWIPALGILALLLVDLSRVSLALVRSRRPR